LTKFDQEFAEGAGKSLDGVRWSTRLQASILNSFDVMLPEKETKYIICISRVMGLITPSASYVYNWKKTDILDYDTY
jgi:hypothetical protein